MHASVCDEGEMLNLPTGSEPKEPKPKHPYYWTMLSKLCILKNGPRWLFVISLGFRRASLLKSEGKDSLLMHAFLPCFLSFLITVPFPFFFFVILLLVSSTFLPWVTFLLSTTTAPIYKGLILWDFSHLLQGFTNYFWSVMDTPSRLPTNPLVAHPLPLLDMPSAFSFFHNPFHDKFPFVWFCYKPFPIVWIDKALGFLITYLFGMH